MRRAICVVLFAGVLLSAQLIQAQQPKIKIAFLSSGSLVAFAGRVEAFGQRLRDLGYTDGQNVSLEYRWAEGKYERLPDLAAELIRMNPSVIVTHATPASRAALQATKTIPIVFVSVSDPVGGGLVASLARPGGNITGLTSQSADLSTKDLELLKEVVPNVTRVAVLWNPANPGVQSQFKEVQNVAQSLGVQLQHHEARDPQELDSVFPAMLKGRAGAVLMLADPMFFDNQHRIADLAARSRLPIICWWSTFAELGGLISYGPSDPDMWRRAAGYVDKILKGAKPADLPVEQPTKFELVVNLKTAKQIGLTVPQSILYRADKVIR